MSYITIEQARKLIDNEDNPQIVIGSIWARHWSNAKNNDDIIILNNLLKNHVRLFNECPELNNGKERENIIQFIQEKISKLSIQ